MMAIFHRGTAVVAVVVSGLMSGPSLARAASESPSATTADVIAPIDALAPDAAVAQVDPAAHGELSLRPNPDALRRWGLSVHGGLPAGDLLQFAVASRDGLDVTLGDGGPTRVGAGLLALPGLVLRRDDGEQSPPLSLRSDGGDARRWQLVDAVGQSWLFIAQAMRSPDGRRELHLMTADLRIGPALARWIAAPSADGALFANAELRLPLRRLDAVKQGAEKSCAVPNWPGTPGFVTDVILTNMDAVDVMRCRTSSLPRDFCDGPGGDDGEVVIVPSVTLRNSSAANATEVPWYTKFSGNFPPYGNDQHPFLVWNLYRVDADGWIEQVARSGLKHAFATANDACVEPCNNPHILGRGCEDLYNAFSNDANVYLSPRREVIPSRGIWGRCGSVFDDGLDAAGAGTPGCDGVADPPPTNDFYRERLVARESDIEPASNPGASYLVDSWYVVRDDIDLFNTMGSRRIVPKWFGGQWDISGNQGPFVPGSVLDRWLALSPPGALQERRVLETPEGRVLVATRVTRLPDTRYRYDYAIFNYDLTRPITSGAEPNLRIERNDGVSAITLSLLRDALVQSHAFRDGDDAASNDWNATVAASDITWNAPDGAALLQWGQLLAVRLVSDSAPGRGELRVTMAEPGAPASHAMPALVPDDALLFRDGFD